MRPFVRRLVVGRREAPIEALAVLDEIEQQLKVSREEAHLDLTEANRRLLRNLAHEIKNPLGGIRGAAQLLESELPSREQREYTRVVISEADRLQALVDRLLEPHRSPRVIGDFNVHEVTERVRSVILAEFPRGLTVMRDYDASVPEIRGDAGQIAENFVDRVDLRSRAHARKITAEPGQRASRCRCQNDAYVTEPLHDRSPRVRVTGQSISNKGGRR